ncbi:hypothetical protein ACFXTN_003266 [Malus domestica]
MKGLASQNVCCKRVTQSVLPFRGMGKRVWVEFVVTKRSSKFSTREPGNRRPPSPAPNQRQNWRKKSSNLPQPLSLHLQFQDEACSKSEQSFVDSGSRYFSSS